MEIPVMATVGDRLELIAELELATLDGAAKLELVTILELELEFEEVVELEELEIQPSRALQTSIAPAPILPLKLGL